MTFLFLITTSLRRYERAICLLLFILALLYICILPHQEISRNAYVSENALMPDYAIGHFQSKFRRNMNRFASRLKDGERNSVDFAAAVFEILTSICGKSHVGVFDNSTVHSVIPSPRGDGTEGLIFMAPYRNTNGEINTCGIAFMLSVIQEFRRYKFWSRDFIIVISGIGKETTSAVASDVEKWLSAYHGTESLSPSSSAVIQAGLSVELNGQECELSFGNAEIYIEGNNGLLPNLDLINTMHTIGRHRGGDIRVFPKKTIWAKIIELIPGKYWKVHDIVRGIGMIWRQALGRPVFSHGPFLRYRIDMVTLSLYQINEQSASDYSDRIAFETMELTFRSLSNILEHLHQSFFFYILLDNDRFVSISNFIAIACLPIVALVLVFVSGASKTTLKSLILSLVRWIISLALTLPCIWVFAKSQHSSSLKIIILQIPFILHRLIVSKLPKPERSILCLIAGLALSTLLFLNFGMSVLLGIIYGPILIFSNGSLAWSFATFLFNPISLYSIALFFGDDWAFGISPKIVSWNYSIPFLIIPSLLFSTGNFLMQEQGEKVNSKEE